MKCRIIYLLVFVLVFFSCVKEKKTGVELAVGDYIPDFEVVMNDGSILSSDGLKDAVSCIVFFNTSCPDCQQTLPVIQKLYDNYEFKGVRFALISREDVAATVAAYWEKKEFTMPYSAQQTREIYNLFAQTRVPRVYICEKGGVIRYIHTDDPLPEFEDLDQQLSSVCDSVKE